MGPITSDGYQRVLEANRQEHTAGRSRPFLPPRPDPKPQVRTIPSSSCGVCGGAYVAQGGYEFCELCGRPAPTAAPRQDERPAPTVAVLKVAGGEVVEVASLEPVGIDRNGQAKPLEELNKPTNRKDRRKALQPTS